MKKSILCGLIALTFMATPAMAHFDESQIWVIDYPNSKLYRVRTDDWTVFVANPLTFPVSSPGSISFNHHGHMLVSNYKGSIIHERDGDGMAVNGIGPADGLDGPYGQGGIAIGPGHGDVFVTNIDSGEILQYTEDLDLEGVYADGSDGLVKPGAMAFFLNGDMLVADRSTHDVTLFDADTGVGAPWDTFGAMPVDIAVRDNKDVYILDSTGTLYRYPGGVVASKTALGTWGSGNGAITFSPDQSVIYHVNPADSQLREIDPDTGVAVVRATIPGVPTGIAMPGSQHAAGTYIDFGVPLAGTGGIDPVLEGVGEPRIGQLTEIDMYDYVGGAYIFLFMSLGMGEASYFGGDFHVDLFDPSTFWFKLPASGTPGVAGDGAYNLSFTMPNSSVLVGTHWFMQALGIDAGAPQGVSFSTCMTMYVGE